MWHIYKCHSRFCPRIKKRHSLDYITPWSISDRMPVIPARQQVKAEAWGCIIMTSCRARTVPGCWYFMQSYCHSPARPALCCLLSDPCTCMHPCFVLGITYSIPEETTEESLYIILLAAPIVRPTPNRSSEDNRPCMHDRNSLYMHVCTLLHLQWPQWSIDRSIDRVVCTSSTHVRMLSEAS